MRQVKQSKRHQHIIFSNNEGAIIQNDTQRCFHLHFKGHEYTLTPCQFYIIKRKLEGIDLIAMLSTPSRSQDFDILLVPECALCMVLSTCDVLQLRDIFEGASISFELHSLLNKNNIKIP